MNSQSRLGLESTVVAIREQISADLADEVAILSLKSGVYYGLNTVGASIWKLIQQPVAIGQIRDALLKEYDVDPERCQQDLLNLLTQMEDHKLVDLRDESPTQTT